MRSGNCSTRARHWIQALHKALLPIGLAALAIGSDASAQESLVIGQAIKGATFCTLSASKAGVDTARFDGDESWQRDTDGSYSAIGMPVKITFPADEDGVSRICVVEATLPSRKDQREMQIVLEALLKRKPIVQSDSLIWMFGGAGNARGLQFFPDSKSEQPHVRLIGAAF